MKKNKNSVVIWLIIFIILFNILPPLEPFSKIIVIIFIVILINLFLKKTKGTVPNKVNNTLNQSISNINENKFILKCTKCGSVLKVTDKFCGSCGEAFDGNNVKVEINENVDLKVQEKDIVTIDDFDPIFKLDENLLIENFIKKEMTNAKIDENSKLIPKEVLNKKKIFNIIFTFLLFVYVCLIFFHFPILTYIIGAVILFIFYKTTRKFTLIKYLEKEIKSRPSEKISNIVMSVKSTFVEDTTTKKFLLSNSIAILISLLIFIKPMILYEHDESWNGYAVRFYAFGLTNFTSATIPSTHNNQNVVSLRGNTFSNMPFLKEVKLPDTIMEIRGQAFKNDRNLKNVNIPNQLYYLGGGAFYNCTSIKSIKLPDSLAYIGGETFKNAKSLEYIKLPNRLAEIRGNTFENCRSLYEIDIPDSVTRIGGHAFYGNTSLSKVNISPNSNLKEIGSSAFRMCNSLTSITIPNTVYVNQRAFKESPTRVYFYNEYSGSYNNWSN